MKIKIHTPSCNTQSIANHMNRIVSYDLFESGKNCVFAKKEALAFSNTAITKLVAYITLLLCHAYQSQSGGYVRFSKEDLLCFHNLTPNNIEMLNAKLSAIQTSNDIVITL
jgi:hypothetical protein